MLGLLVLSLHALASPVSAARDNPFLARLGPASPAGLFDPQADERSVPVLVLRPAIFHRPWKGLTQTPNLAAPYLGGPPAECVLTIIHANPDVDAQMVRPMAAEVDAGIIRRSRCVP